MQPDALGGSWRSSPVTRLRRKVTTEEPSRVVA
jgi:hypothetical protein